MGTIKNEREARYESLSTYFWNTITFLELPKRISPMELLFLPLLPPHLLSTPDHNSPVHDPSSPLTVTKASSASNGCHVQAGPTRPLSPPLTLPSLPVAADEIDGEQNKIELTRLWRSCALLSKDFHLSASFMHFFDSPWTRLRVDKAPPPRNHTQPLPICYNSFWFLKLENNEDPEMWRTKTILAWVRY